MGEDERGVNRDYWCSALSSEKGMGPGIQMEEMALPWSMGSSSTKTVRGQVPGNRYE